MCVCVCVFCFENKNQIRWWTNGVFTCMCVSIFLITNHKIWSMCILGEIVSLFFAFKKWELENSKIGKSVPDGVIRDVIMLFLKPLANLGDSSLFVIQNVLKSMLLLRKGITLLLRESEFLIKPYVILSMFVPHKSIFKKKYLWEEIYNLMSSEQERAWIIYGDFNEVGNRRSARDTHLTLKVHMNLINLSIC